MLVLLTAVTGLVDAVSLMIAVASSRTEARPPTRARRPAS
jgi:hypothetical protein